MWLPRPSSREGVRLANLLCHLNSGWVPPIGGGLAYRLLVVVPIVCPQACGLLVDQIQLDLRCNLRIGDGLPTYAMTSASVCVSG